MKTLQKFGLAIKYFRKSQNLSQENLAEKSSLHRTYISSVERGERNIALLNIEKIANALSISPVLLIEKTFEMDENNG